MSRPSGGGGRAARRRPDSGPGRRAEVRHPPASVPAWSTGGCIRPHPPSWPSPPRGPARRMRGRARDGLRTAFAHPVLRPGCCSPGRRRSRCPWRRCCRRRRRGRSGGARPLPRWSWGRGVRRRDGGGHPRGRRAGPVRASRADGGGRARVGGGRAAGARADAGRVRCRGSRFRRAVGSGIRAAHITPSVLGRTGGPPVPGAGPVVRPPAPGPAADAPRPGSRRRPGGPGARRPRLRGDDHGRRAAVPGLAPFAHRPRRAGP